MQAAYAVGCEIADRVDAAALSRGVEATEREFWDSLATGNYPEQETQPEPQAAAVGAPPVDISPEPQTGTAQVIQLSQWVSRANQYLE